MISTDIAITPKGYVGELIEETGTGLQCPIFRTLWRSPVVRIHANQAYADAASAYRRYLRDKLSLTPCVEQ